MSIKTIIIHSKSKGNQLMTIDEEDYDKIKHLNLTLNFQSNPNTFYCKHTVYVNKVYIKKIHIHRLIMGLGDYKVDKRIVHHIDNNGLNNCKSNLEICDTMYNSQACRRIDKDSYKNYNFENDPKRKCKWRVWMTINGERHQKRFKTEQDCIEYIDLVRSLIDYYKL